MTYTPNFWGDSLLSVQENQTALHVTYDVMCSRRGVTYIIGIMVLMRMKTVTTMIISNK